MDVALVRFEKAWHTGEAPRIEAYLEEAEEPERSLLLRGLIGLELELERGTGRSPDVSEYLRRFACDSWLIDQGFLDAQRQGHPNACDQAGVPTSFDEAAGQRGGCETTAASFTGGLETGVSSFFRCGKMN